jgi:NADH-quinone oxidoreductase subunit A
MLAVVNTSADYFPILVQAILAAALAAGIIGVSHLLGQRARGGAIKDSAYECGVKPEGMAHTRFSVKFYVTAMLFILFDIEVVFMFPWAVLYREYVAAGLGLFMLMEMVVFIGILVLGLAYVWRKGALEWD